MTGRVPFNRPVLMGSDLEYMADAVGRMHISGDGFYTNECNRLLEGATGGHTSLLTTSCTHALEMSALLLEVGPGDEIIMPSFTLRASLPAMHALRLHVVDGGRHFAGDDGVLGYRAFRVGVTPQRIDVVSSISGFRVGAGWYQLEEFGGWTFRWVSNDATVEVLSHATELALEVEPGPGVGKQPFTLAAIGPRGEELALFAVGGRKKSVIPLRPDEAPPYVITLRVTGGDRTTIGDSRILNFCAFQSR